MLFNIYINELTRALEQTYSTRHWSQMSPVCRWSGAAVNQNKRVTAATSCTFGQTRALTVNTKKRKIMIFWKRHSCQEQHHNFKLDYVLGTHSKLHIPRYKQETLTRLWTCETKQNEFFTLWKISKLTLVIEPILLCGFEVCCGLLTYQEFIKLAKHPIENLLAAYAIRISK